MNEALQRPRFCLFLLSWSLLTAILADCGGSSGGSGGGGGSQNPTTITVTFTTAPTSSTIGVQTGTGPFVPLTLQSGSATFTVPAGTTRYSIAYFCFVGETPGASRIVVVYQATIQDGTSVTQGCSSAFPRTGPASGSADASSIPGTVDILLVGGQGSRGFVGSSSGPFTANLAVGTSDIAAVALSQITPIEEFTAVKLIRNQTIPGPINGGATITVGPGDELTDQPLTVNNLPADFAAPSVTAGFNTANGTTVFLPTSNTQYGALPGAAVQSGDFYSFQAISSDMATQTSTIGVIQTTTNGGGPATVNFPDPFAGPGISFPTFTFNYAGFSGMPNLLYHVSITWPVPGPVGGTDFDVINATATGRFLNGSSALTIPDASAAGFFGPPGSGVNVTWSSALFGGTTPIPARFFSPLSPNVTLLFVENSGSLTVP